MKKLFYNKKAMSGGAGGAGGDLSSSDSSPETEDNGSNFVVSSKIFHFAFILVLVILAFVAFVLISQNYIDSLAAVPPILDRELMMARMTNICFSPEDPITGYRMQNVIELSEFNKPNFLQCFSDTNLPKMNAKLESISGEYYTNPPFEKTQITTTNDNLDFWMEHYVLVYHNGKYYPSHLRIDID